MKAVTFFLTTLLIVVSAWAEPASFLIALKPDKNPEAMLKEREELEKFLSAETGRKVKVIIPLSGSVIHEGFLNGTID